MKTALQPANRGKDILEFRVQGSDRAAMRWDWPLKNKLVLYKKRTVNMKNWRKPTLVGKMAVNIRWKRLRSAMQLRYPIDGEIAFRYVDEDEPLFVRLGGSFLVWASGSQCGAFIEAIPVEKEEK